MWLASWEGFVTRRSDASLNQFSIAKQLQLVRRSGTGCCVENDLTLDRLAPLERAEITRVDWSVLAPDEGKRLRAMGIDEGARIAIAHRGIFMGSDPIALMVGRMTVAVRRVHARAMWVKLI